MPYPRLLNLSEGVRDRLVSYLDTEITNHLAERSNYVDDLLKWQRDYWAKPSTERATFPFSGAATIVIPLTAIAVETIHARMMTTLFGLPNFVSAKPNNPEWVTAARPYERYLDRELRENVRIRDFCNDSILSCVKYGTQVGKSGYERIVRQAIYEVDGREYERPVVVRNSATADSVPLAKFLLPFYAKDPQTSPWVGEEHTKTPYEILGMENGGLFYPNTFDKLRRYVGTRQLESQGHKFEEAQAELEKMSIDWPKTLDFYEIWLSFNVDGDPVVNEYGEILSEFASDNKEIVVHYHKDSRTLLACRYNYYEDLHRPYRIGVYFPVEYRWNGIGVGKQNEQFMREVTTQHRQRLDNATLANVRMIKIHKLSGYGPKEPIFPGKMWFLDDMTHVEPIQLGEVYPSAYNNESATLQYSQQRTGVNEVVLGMPQVGTPGTATSDLARIQEGNKKFDFIYANTKEYINDIVVDVAANMHQFGARNVEWFENAENGDLVKNAFNLPATSIRDGLIFELRATGQQENKIVDRQNWIQIGPVYQQYIAGMLQLAQMSGDKNIAMQILQHGMVGATEIMRQLLETYDARNIDRILLTQLFDQLNPNQSGAQSNGSPQTGGPPGIDPSSGFGGMANLIAPVAGNGTPSVPANGRF